MRIVWQWKACWDGWERIWTARKQGSFSPACHLLIKSEHTVSLPLSDFVVLCTKLILLDKPTKMREYDIIEKYTGLAYLDRGLTFEVLGQEHRLGRRTGSQLLQRNNSSWQCHILGIGLQEKHNGSNRRWI